MNIKPKFSEFLDAFMHEDSNFLTYACERYRVGTDRPATYVLKRRSSPEAHTEGNISGFEVHKVLEDGKWSLIPLAEQKPWLINALNIARAPRAKEQKRNVQQRRAQRRAELVKSGFYQSQEYKDWERKHRSAR
ncbi:hypothetical protein [Acinetobacter thermotolerans]|uniref:hypothetical protein n=1 Tax=Acinetobacter thermotolerans TaxID=3151487 RepID=UPI00325A71AC